MIKNIEFIEQLSKEHNEARETWWSIINVEENTRKDFLQIKLGWMVFLGVLITVILSNIISISNIKIELCIIFVAIIISIILFFGEFFQIIKPLYVVMTH